MFGTGVRGFAIITSVIGVLTYMITFVLLRGKNVVEWYREPRPDEKHVGERKQPEGNNVPLADTQPTTVRSRKHGTRRLRSLFGAKKEKVVDSEYELEGVDVFASGRK